MIAPNDYLLSDTFHLREDFCEIVHTLIKNWNRAALVGMKVFKVARLITWTMWGGQWMSFVTQLDDRNRS
jgi:hypothetical protein